MVRWNGSMVTLYFIPIGIEKNPVRKLMIDALCFGELVGWIGIIHGLLLAGNFTTEGLYWKIFWVKVIYFSDFTFFGLCEIEADYCPPGWYETEDACYGLINEGNWTMSQKKCESFKADLVKFTSKEENDYVKNVVCCNKTDLYGSKNRRHWMVNSPIQA